jgi:toxin ParE1/3/4
MAVVRYSPLAEIELDSIARYTKEKWGVRQASLYINKVVAECERLAENPGLGRRYANLLPEIRRMECGSHVIYYKPQEDGILVGGILHKRMLPKKHGL